MKPIGGGVCECCGYKTTELFEMTYFPSPGTERQEKICVCSICALSGAWEWKRRADVSEADYHPLMWMVGSLLHALNIVYTEVRELNDSLRRHDQKLYHLGQLG